MLLTESEYTALTSDAAPTGFDAAQARVLATLEAVVGRPLEDAARKERLEYDEDGEVWPSARPVTAVGWEGEYEFDERSIYLGPARRPGSLVLEYRGGWTVETAPALLKEAIAYGIQHATAPGDPSEPPAWVKSMSVAGEFSYTRVDGATTKQGASALGRRSLDALDLYLGTWG